ncbi:MAG: AgmX/PglI C-terminal domain-containing protein [Deltaproteobacteria bacterium]|nr:AgmX/PglI C-terminal domain-containing protein [Deltaproteobacteria bacterium]
MRCSPQDEAYFAARISQLKATRTSSATDGVRDPTGPRSKKAITAVIHQSVSDVGRCFLYRSVQPSGELRVSFAIAAGGQVDRACVLESTFTTDAVPGCILELMRHLRFRAASEETIVTYPFRFSLSRLDGRDHPLARAARGPLRHAFRATDRASSRSCRRLEERWGGSCRGSGSRSRRGRRRSTRAPRRPSGRSA